MRYGIFGCTADPFTCAHYEIVNKVLKDKLVDKVIVIPTIVDYYRKDKKRLFSNGERLGIIYKWFENREDVIVDNSEYKLAAAVEGVLSNDVVPNKKEYKKTITERRYWHTLKDVVDRYGSDNEYMTIVGEDSWNNITSWYNFRDLGKMTKFIVVVRENKSINYYINYEEFHQQPYKVIELEKKFGDVSATSIRKHLTEACGGMSIGTSGNPFNVYMEEIEDYTKCGKTYSDRKKEYDDLSGILFDTIVEVEKEEVVAHTPIFDVIKGKEVESGFRPVKIKSKDWVSIIVEKDGKFLMEKQLRHGLNKEFEEFPCGMIEENEEPVVAALRELEEETGLKLNTYDLSYLGKYAANPAFMTNYMHYFYVRPKSYEEIDTKLDKHEHLISYWIDKGKAFKNFLESKGSSIMGCAWMLLMKDGILNEWED